MTEGPLQPDEAAELILSFVQQTPIERVPLLASLGSVLAEPIVAAASIPPWRSASMDGFAVRTSDVSTVPCRLIVVGEALAGAPRPPPLGDGEALRIMTGARVPDGADTVIRIEDTRVAGNFVEILRDRDLGRNVRPLGEDFLSGDTLLGAGSRMTPGAIGVLASAGVVTVATHRAPAVSVVSSGDELVRLEDFAKVLEGTRIVSSNSYSLPALVREAGGRPTDGGIATDDPVALRRAIERTMACDVIVTSGGVSVGDRDFTRSVMTQMGADIKFWRARIRPGGPIVFAVLDGIPWVGLPGNPVSAMVTFELFVRPVILKMLGEPLIFPATRQVTLDETVTVSGDLTHYLRVIISDEHDGFHARLTGTQSSGALTSMMRANGLLIVPEGKREYRAGEQLNAITIGGAALRSRSFPK